MNFFKWYYKQLQKSQANLKILLTRKCPRCDSTDLNKVRPNPISGGLRDLGNFGMAVAFPITIFAKKKPKSKPLNVCRKCGFSWEDR